MVDSANKSDLLTLTSEIVAAHVANNSVAVTDLPKLIHDVHRALAGIGDDTGKSLRPEPAAPVNKSVTPDYIVCLEDGKKLKMLKRHLMTAYGLTPQQYRERWDLPLDYPMVAPSYAKHRSNLAKKIGLGTKGKQGK
jgi:predicted transcriptional regulator